MFVWSQLDISMATMILKGVLSDVAFTQVSPFSFQIWFCDNFIPSPLHLLYPYIFSDFLNIFWGCSYLFKRFEIQEDESTWWQTSLAFGDIMVDKWLELF